MCDVLPLLVVRGSAGRSSAEPHPPTHLHTHLHNRPRPALLAQALDVLSEAVEELGLAPLQRLEDFLVVATEDAGWKLMSPQQRMWLQVGDSHEAEHARRACTRRVKPQRWPRHL